MGNVFVVSDTHFGHQNMYSFLNSDGSKVRPWDTAKEADEIMAERWNTVVNPNDKVYHLGDVAIHRRALKVLETLNGRKVLIKGNHDIFKLKDYLEHFKDICAYKVLDGMVLSHVPVHPGSLGRFKFNVHGHLHLGVVMLAEVPDNRYMNVCVEHTNYSPIPLELIQRIKTERGRGLWETV